MQNVAIVGMGVNGLSTAYEVARRHDVTVFHDRPLFKTTSAVATAIWHVYLVDKDDVLNLGWSARTLQRLMKLSEIPETSVELCEGIELYVRGEATRPSWSDIAPKFELVPEEEFKARYPGREWGYTIAAPTANMAKYLPWLHQSCLDAGVTFRNEQVNQLEDLFEDFDIVVNCAGLASGTLTEDEKLYPVKGQYVTLELRDGAPTHYVGDDQNPAGMAYIIPRDGQMLVGGTEEENVADLEFTADRDAMIKRASEYIDYDLTTLRQIASVVGLRPCREGGIVRFGHDEHQPKIIHNYGHGGSGFSLAWGCAEDIAALVDALEQPEELAG